MEDTTNSVDSLSSQNNETYVRFDITQRPEEEEPTIKITSGYSGHKPQHVHSFITSICSHDGFSQLVETFYDRMSETDEEGAMQFLTKCVAEYGIYKDSANMADEEEEEQKEEQPDREIAWLNRDQAAIMENNLLELEKTIKEETGDDDIRLVRTNIDEDSFKEEWIGYTNFDVIKVSKDIQKTRGVDLFVHLSRYSFSITIGKLFSFSDVRAELHDKLSLKNSQKTV